MGRNRIERRTVSVFKPSDRLANTGWEDHAKTIIRVERDVFTFSAATGTFRHSAETAYYLANAPLIAKITADAIRAHWGVETTSYYSRDVTLGEDRSRIRSNPSVFARIRSFAFNILKANHTSTLPQDRYRAALNGLNPLLNLLRIKQR
jgi:predicted transposase YbfD/YdcC